MTNNNLNKSILLLSNVIMKHKKKVKVTIGENNNINFNSLGKDSVIYLESGSVSLYRKKDNILLFKFDAPFIFGLEKAFSNSDNYYLISNQSISIYFLSYEDTIKSFDRHNLWKYATQILCHFMKLSEHRIHHLIENKDTYSIIKTNLEMIWLLPVQERDDTSIFNFILKRSTISRSSITKILKQLNDGGYITTKRGRLIEYNNLPTHF